MFDAITVYIVLIVFLYDSSSVRQAMTYQH